MRLLCASLASGLHATDVFIVSTLQKALLREIKLADAAVHAREKVKFFPSGKRWGLPAGKGSKEDKEDNDEAEDGVGDAKGVASELPTKDNPLLVTIYGQISLAAKSYQSALCMFSFVPSLDAHLQSQQSISCTHTITAQTIP